MRIHSQHIPSSRQAELKAELKLKAKVQSLEEEHSRRVKELEDSSSRGRQEQQEAAAAAAEEEIRALEGSLSTALDELEKAQQVASEAAEGARAKGGGERGVSRVAEHERGKVGVGQHMHERLRVCLL